MAPVVRSPGFPYMLTASQQIPTSSYQMPVIGPRVRANSVNLPASQTTRKRTSSGIFQVDETRTVSDSAENSRSKSEGIDVNGRRKEKKDLSPTHSNRKRTSSGVFETDDLGPPPKKPEVTKPEVLKKNVRRKEKEASTPEQKREKEDKIIDKFDSETKSVCVNAFKESDSWD